MTQTRREFLQAAPAAVLLPAAAKGAAPSADEDDSGDCYHPAMPQVVRALDAAVRGINQVEADHGETCGCYFCCDAVYVRHTVRIYRDLLSSVTPGGARGCDA